MTTDELYSTIADSPEVKNLGYDPPTLLNLCKKYAEIITVAIINSHEWDFAMDVADETLVASTAVYQLKGNSNDCRRIKSIRYGASGAADTLMKPILRKNHVDLDHYLERVTPGECEIWIRRKPKQRFPQIQLLATPTGSANVIRYRYWMKNLTINDLDLDDFAMVLLIGCRYLLNPVLKRAYEAELVKAIQNIQPPSNEPMMTMVDPQIVAENIYRYGLPGY